MFHFATLQSRLPFVPEDALVTGVISAVVTALVAFWIGRRFRRRDDLKSLYQEVKQNRDEAIRMIRDIGESIPRRKKFLFENPKGQSSERIGQHDPHVHTFNTSAYENAIKRGVLGQISKENKERVHVHYQYIKEINGYVSEWRQIRAQRESYDDLQTLKKMIEVEIDIMRLLSSLDEFEDHPSHKDPHEHVSPDKEGFTAVMQAIDEER